MMCEGRVGWKVRTQTRGMLLLKAVWTTFGVAIGITEDGVSGVKLSYQDEVFTG